MAALTIVQSGSSDQYSANVGQRTKYIYAPVNPRDGEGTVHRQTFTVTLATQAVGTYGLAFLPKGCRIYGISWIQSVTFGATATLALGLTTLNADGLATLTGNLGDGTAISLADDAAGATGLFRAAATQATTTILTFGQTIALGWGVVPSKDVALTMTIAAAALPASGSIVGYVDYVLGR